jgi:DNA repair exonuclease SbcCD nuclease subunit
MPFQPLFAFSADLHLQPCAWVKHPTLRGDAYESFRQIVDFCIQVRIPLILGGDIFDSKRPDPLSVRYFGQQVARMFEADQNVSFIQGDHDFHPHAPWPTVSGMAIPLNGMSVTAGGYNIFGLDWTPRDSLPAALCSVPEGTDFLVTHQAWQEIQGIGQVEGSVTHIPHANFLLTGDYHVALQKDVQAEDGRGVQVWSPGSICMQSIDERYEKSFLVIGIEEGDLVVRREPLLTRMKFDLIYNTEEEFAADLVNRHVFDEIIADERLEHLPECIRKPIVRVTFNDEIPDALTRIEAAADGRFHIFPNPQRVVEEVEVDFDEVPEGAFGTLLDACRRLATDESAYNLAARLLRSEDPEAELERMYDEFRHSFESAEADTGAATGG